MNKHRFLALDGIRGFAALSVAISHIGFNTRLFTESPVVSYLFRIFSAGPTSVQLFFVLSGLLMAYLYPTVADPLKFWEKRYLRIMPVFGVVVISIGLSLTYYRGASASVAILLLLAVAAVAHVLWLVIAKLQRFLPNIGHLLFFSFIAFQLFWLGLSVMTTLGPGAALLERLSFFQEQFFYMFSNLTMTMYWQKDLVVMEGVFWSLVPEMMFYIVYPVIAVPLLMVSSKISTKWNVLLIGIVLVVLFQLDSASRALFSLHGIFVSRASGFVIGLSLGSLYRSKGPMWQWFSKAASSIYLSIPLILLFGFTMALEWPDRYHQIRQFVMLHYLVLSLLFGIIVAAALVTGSAVQKLFERKIFVFLGMISYSLYVTHSFVMEKINSSEYMYALQDQLSKPMFSLVRGFLLLSGSILVATALYYLVEALYFRKTDSKKTVGSLTNVIDRLTNRMGRSTVIALGAISISLLIVFLNSTDSIPSLLLSKHSLTGGRPLSLIQVTGEQPQQFQFTAKHSHLSALQLAMDYAHDPNLFREETLEPLQLVFTLTDDIGKEIVRSERHPQELAGEPQFPFGFPTQEDSAGKSYIVTLALENVGPTDEVMVYSDTGIVAQYTTDHLPFGVGKLFRLVALRFLFGLWQWQTLVTVGLIGIIGVLVAKQKK